MKLTAHYTSFAEYMAACDSDSSKRVAHYAEQERQAAEEARIRRHAAMWERLSATHIDTLYNLADAAPTTESFLAHFEQ